MSPATPSNSPGPSPPPTVNSTSNDTSSTPTGRQLPLAGLPAQQGYLTTRYRVALGVLVVAPVLMVLPPRKADAYTFGLGCAWVCCANEAVRFHTGRSLLESIGRNSPPPKLLPEQGGVADEMRRGWMGESVYSQLHPPQPGEAR